MCTTSNSFSWDLPWLELPRTSCLCYMNDLMRNRKEYHLLPKLIKGSFREWLGENIHNLIFCGYIIQFNNLVGSLFFKQMVFDRDVLGLGMKDEIFSNVDCTCVVT